MTSTHHHRTTTLQGARHKCPLIVDQGSKRLSHPPRSFAAQYPEGGRAAPRCRLPPRRVLKIVSGLWQKSQRDLVRIVDDSVSAIATADETLSKRRRLRIKYGAEYFALR